MRRPRTPVRAIASLVTLALAATLVNAIPAAADSDPGGTLLDASISLNTDATGVTGVDYTLGFTTSSTGALTSDTGTVTVAAPDGTGFLSSAAWTFTDLTSGDTGYEYTYQGTSSGSTVLMPVPIDIAAGDQVELVISSVTNPGAAGPAALSISTSADRIPVPLPYTLVAPGPISDLSSISLSTNAAGATEVTYGFGFTASATGGLAAYDGYLDVTAPAGSDLYGAADLSSYNSYADWTITDTTTGQSATTSASQADTSDWDGDLADIAIPLPIEIDSGDQVQVSAAGIGSPNATGSATWKVKTSSDAVSVTSPAFSLTAAGSVSHVTDVTLSSTAAGVKDVQYDFGFTASSTGALASGYGMITVSAPTGTDFNGADTSSGSQWTVTDTTTGDSATTFADFGSLSDNGATDSVPAPITINPGDQVQISADGVTNPATTGPATLSVSTSSDPTPKASPAYTITSGGAVSQITDVTLTSAAANAFGVTYTLGFTTSDTGGLAANFGQLLLTLPPGTTYGDGADETLEQPAYVQVTDETSGAGAVSNWVVPGETDNVLDIVTPVDIAGGDQVEVTVAELTNPSSAGPRTIGIATTSDSTVELSPAYTVDAASGVTDQSITVDASEAGATTNYTVGFTASADGALTGYEGAITISAAPGTQFATPGTDGSGPTVQYFAVNDLTTGDYAGSDADDSTILVGDSGATITIPCHLDISPGDQVQVTLVGVVNSSTVGPASLSVSTSSDTVPETASYAITAATSVGAPSLSLSTSAAGSQSTYTIGFTAGGALDQGYGDIQLSGPAGTVFPDQSDFTIDDLTSGQSDTSSAQIPDVAGNQVTFSVPIAIAAGDQVVLTVPDVVNTNTPGPAELTLTTDSDTVPVSLPFAITGGTTATDADLSVSTTAAGAHQVAYTATLTTSSTGALSANGGTVTLTGPAGVDFSQVDGAVVTDLTSDSSGGTYSITASPDGTSAVVTVPIDVAGGDRISVELDGVTNGPDPGPAAFTVSTGPDPALLPVSVDFTAAQPVSGVNVSLSHDEATAPDTTYTVGFTTSSTGALHDDGAITIDAPDGTAFPGHDSDYCVQIADSADCVTPSTDAGTGTGTGSTASNTVTVYPGVKVPTGTTVVLTITDVTNGTVAGNQNLAVTTSSDTVADDGAFQVSPSTAAAITGTVSFSGSPVPRALLEFCPDQGTSGACFSDATDASGSFFDPVQFGNYAVTADAPVGSGASDVTIQVATTTAAPIATNEIVLGQPIGLPAGATLSNPDTGTAAAGVVPTIYWGTPSTFTITGAPTGSIGFLSINGVNTETGDPERTPVALSETTSGSGIYTGTIPALIPQHGAASAEVMIMPTPTVTPRPTDQTCGVATGGGRILVNLAGKGAASSVSFGAAAGTGLQEVDPGGLYSVIAPAGTGTVEMTAQTASGSVDLGPWCYITVGGLSSSTGPALGGNTITITADHLGPDPYFFFGDAPSADVTQTSSSTYSVSVPPGDGDETVFAVSPDAGGSGGGGLAAVKADAKAAVKPQVEDSGGGGAIVPVGTYHRSTSLPASGVDQADSGYYAQSPGLLTMKDMVAASESSSPGAFAGLAGSGLETLIHDLTGYDFTEGPSSLLLALFGAELLFAGPAGWVYFALLLFLTSELDRSLFEFYDLLIDPSGTVVDRSGDPVPGASVTLEQQTGPGGAWEPVPASSAGIQPNQNPETTDANGLFDWDAAAGAYRIEAVSDSCQTTGGQPATADSATFTLPPPAVGLVITLPCQLGTATAPRIDGLNPGVLPDTGGAVQVTGLRVGAATSVTVGGHSVPFTPIDSGTLEITAPAGSGTEKVVVTTPAGADTSQNGDDELTYLAEQQQATTTALSASANPVTAGQSVTFTATVAAQATGSGTGTGTGTPTGSVVFTVDGATEPAVALTSGGTATFTDSALSAGPHTVTATYSGDGGFTGSSSATLTETVNQPTSTALTVAPIGSAPKGSPVTLSAAVSPAVAGSVQFLDGTTALGSPVAVTAGVATYSTNALAQGTHSLSAVFTPTAGYDLGSTSPTVPYTVTAPPAGLAIDQTITQTGTGTVATAPFSTTGPRLLVAFTGADGPGSKQTTTITGGGLTWTLVTRENGQLGTADIWEALATGPLTNVTVTSTEKHTGYDQQVTVVSFIGASGVGASAIADKSTGEQSVSLTTTQAGSWVFGAGEDYTRAITRTVGTGQNLVSQWVDNGPQETFWVQDQAATTAASGTTVTLNDTAPTIDTWNLAAVEILAAAS